MKVVILLTFILAFAVCDKWAVLVAGSNTWSNYRHQADVYHAYQTLIAGGFDPSRIITMAYNDIANSTSNPYKGKVFNKPSYALPGVDVYEGVSIDYEKINVTPEVFQAVLEGNKAYVQGKGTGRVLETSPSDNVFVFFSDHGAVGLIAFPSKYLYADSLLQTFEKMKGKFNKLVFYLETCESGSMFQKLPADSRVYALSAANPTESSWGTYCSPDDVIQGKHINSCLGDLFSVNFIQDLDKGNYAQTLDEHFKLIQKETSLSHVMQWGDRSFTSDLIGDFVTGPLKLHKNIRFVKVVPRIGTKAYKASPMDSRTIRLQTLANIYSREKSIVTFRQMMEEMKSMQKYDRIFNSLENSLQIDGKYDANLINFECIRNCVSNFEEKCGKFSDYGLKYIAWFAKGCEKLGWEKLINAVNC